MLLNPEWEESPIKVKLSDPLSDQYNMPKSYKVTVEIIQDNKTKKTNGAPFVPRTPKKPSYVIVTHLFKTIFGKRYIVITYTYTYNLYPQNKWYRFESKLAKTKNVTC